MRHLSHSNYAKQLVLLIVSLALFTVSFAQTTIFSAASTPAVPNSNDGTPIEIGVKFRVTQAGYITGVRFYKGTTNTGTHIGHLWSSTGTKLAEATFINETASGWQQILFPTPVAVVTNTTYVASYFSSAGGYAITNPFFSAATVNGPLRALATGEDGGNGVYLYTAASAFPNNTYQSSNYWVDVVFATTITPDVTAPTVSITAPAAGTVSGIINVTANASDNIGVVGVQFLLDGVNLSTEDVSSPYSVSWNTVSATNGNHTLTARARDAAGNTTTSASVVVNVNNVVDVTPPAVSITAPTGGTVAGTISVTANASDNIGIAGVQFLLNGANLDVEDVSAPYSISWNTISSANGNYTLSARARDAAGNTTTSTVVNVTVSNTTLMLALPLNENTGTTAGDISGANHPGTLTNGPVWALGRYGQSVTLDGTNDYINIPDHNDFSLDPTQSYTWSSWIRCTNFNEWKTVWSQTLDGSNFFYYYAHTSTDPDGGPVTNGISAYWWNNDGTNKVGVHTNNNVLTANTWAHVVITYNGSLAQNNRFTIYVNGVDVTNRTDVSSSGTLAAINPTNIRIGANQPFGEYFNGGIDEVRYYKKALTLAEVQSDMNTALGVADVTAPTVSITAPAAGTVSGTINVTANAADNVGVAGVQFLLDGVNLSTEDVSSPYSVSWNTATATNGTHTLTARARDAAGNTTTSTSVVVTANNDLTAPTVSITAPAAGTVSGTINVTANAADNIGVVGVQFLLDGVNLSTEDVSAPYSVSWNTTTATNGSHTLTARARDAAGNTTTSTSVVVSVNNDTQAPTVSITAPAAGIVSATINVSANASDNVGVVGVQFLLDGNNLDSEDLVAPYTISWNTATTTNASHTLTARARDAAGNITTSTSVVVTVLNIAPDLTPPTVSITAPAAGTVTGTINVTANASDNIGVVGVQFLLDGVNLSTEDLSAPYSVSWNTLTATNGNHTLTARARDAAGNTTTSTSVVVNVNNDTQAPTVSITAPAAGTVAGTINVDANASDNVGVVGVQFLLDGNNLGSEDLVAPYTVSWNTTTATEGNHTLTARARDAAGNITTSTSVVVNVLNNPPDVTAPTVSMTAPAAGNVTGTINVTANASDNIGVVGVQFLLNGANLGSEDLSAPYSISWNTLLNTNGSYTLTARARDAAGNTTTSAGVIVTVNNDTQAPTVSITAPAAGIVLGTINVNANASDNVGVVGVQFLLDGNNLGSEDLGAPYTVSWNTTTATEGSHTLTARARDAAGNITTSSSVVVTVQNVAPDTQAPTVSLTAPAAGTVSNTINVNANASDNIGVVGVQFLLNGASLGTEDLSSPYSISWNTTLVSNGNYTLSARARDAAGNTTTSTVVNVTVFNNPNLIVSLNFNEGTGTSAADLSGNNHAGTLTNSPTWVAGRYGQGVSLDGVNDYVNISDHSDFTLDPTQSYTWSSWIRPNNFNEWTTVWSQTLDGSNFFYYYAHTSTDPDGGPVTNGISAYWWCNNGAAKVGVHSNNNVLTVGQWSNVTITYDASLAQNNRFTIYVNGVDVTARGDVSSSGTLTSINTTGIRIGSNQPYGEYISASIDEVRFYKRLLSAAEVTTDMNTPIANSIVPVLTPATGSSGIAANTTVTALFNVAMDAATINGSTIELRNSANVLVASTVSYNSTTRTATLTPSSALAFSSTYTARVKSGASGVKDSFGNTMTTDYVSTFTIVDPPLPAPTEGPGGPILVISTTTNPFSRYAVEILRAEGLNHFAAADISTVTATTLNSYDVVVLGEMTVTAAQVTMFTNWVNAGGTLIAFRPSSLLTPLMGISTAGGTTLSDKYLLINTTSGPGVGLVNQTIQFHGTANLHTLSGASNLATLYSTATTATSNPAVTTREVGSNGGRAVAFTYDLAKSIIYTRQGNPAWAGQKRDGQIDPIRSDDMFFPDWIDFNKVAIPQADEQQRLLANIILQGNLHRKPLPRFWYLPRDLKAAIVMTGDDHAVNGTEGRFNQYLTLGPNTAQDVADWRAVRGTSYIFPNTGMSNATAVAFQSQGFEIALHPTTDCANFTLASLTNTYTNQLLQFSGNFPGLASPVSNRNHCLVWSDWASGAKAELSKGMRIDVNYYYWPGAWIQNRPGMFTGSGMPMRFADLDGSLIDVYQATTQMTDESNITYTSFCNAVLDKALGSEGYYGVFTTNMHTDQANHPGSNEIIASAQARNVPVISAKQMLTWLDGRNNSFFSNLNWSGTQLSFNIFGRTGANNLKAMLPMQSDDGTLVSITMNGAPVTFTTQTIKGIQYAFFPAALGNNAYVATYNSALRVAMPPAEQDVVVLSETTETASSSTAATEKQSSALPASEKLEVKVMPNPSSSYFNLSIKGDYSNTVAIKVQDMFGKTVEIGKAVPGTNVKVGQGLAAGAYFVEVVQGDQRKIVKIIKVN